MSTANVGHGATIAAPTTTAYTIAVTVRRSRSAARIGLTSKAPLPPGVRADGLVEILHREVRPERGRRPHLRVGDLPQKEVRYAQLAAGADEEVRVRMVRRVQARRDRRLVDVIRLHAVADDPPNGVDDLGAAAVVERERHHAVRARGRRLHRGRDRLLQPGGELVESSDHFEADVVLHQGVGLSSDRLLEERHQPADLVGLARPVLGGEAVERQVLDAALARGAQGAPDRLDARAVTGDCGKVTPTRPSAVPVHDDRDVQGYGHARRGYTSRISFSLAAPTSSAMRMYR